MIPRAGGHVPTHHCAPWGEILNWRMLLRALHQRIFFFFMFYFLANRGIGADSFEVLIQQSFKNGI